MTTTKTVKAFDKIQNLQWASENWLDNSPYDLFKQIITTKGFGHKDLLAIGEALLVFGQDDVDKSRVKTYLSTLDEFLLREVKEEPPKANPVEKPVEQIKLENKPKKIEKDWIEDLFD